MALLDFLFGGGGGLLPSYQQPDPERIGAIGGYQYGQPSPLDTAKWPFGPMGAPSQLPPNSQPTSGAMPMQQPQGGPGFGDRLTAGLQGFLQSGSPMGAVGNLLGGLMTGSRTDPAGMRQTAVQGMLTDLLRKGTITPVQAQFLVQNPKALEELGKAMINVPITMAPDGSIIQSRPFGQLNVPGGVPISERMEVVNPDQSKSPAFGIKPSLSNPRGSIVTPGSPAAPQVQPQPPVGRPRPSEPVTTASPQATEESQAVGKGLADDYTKINQKSAAATKTLGTLQRMSQLSDKAFDGAAAPAQQFIRSALVSFGFSPGSVPAGEEFTALANKLTLDAMNGSLGAGVSNADVMFIQNINPNMSHTVAGRKELITTLTALAKRDQDVAREAVKYRSQNGTMDGFQGYIAQWAEANPLFRGRENVASFNERSGSSVLKPGDTGYKIIEVR